MDIVIDIIDRFGFPIACVVMLFWQSEQLRKQNQEQTNMWYEALNQNTAILSKIAAKLEIDQ